MNMKDPKQIVMNMLKNNSNPILNNLVKMAEQGNISGVEQFARNLMKEQGRDFDKELEMFKNYFK